MDNNQNNQNGQYDQNYYSPDGGRPENDYRVPEENPYYGQTGTGDGYYNSGQGASGQSYSSEQGQPYGSQPYAGQSYNGQSYGGQPYGGQSYNGQSYGEQPYGGQSYSGQSQGWQQQGQQPYQNYAQPQRVVVHAEDVSKSNGLATASLVLGILSLVFFCIYYVAIILAIIGAILGIVSLAQKRGGRGLAIAGVVTSGIGFALSVLIIIGVVASLSY